MDQASARIRENQRRSRARRNEYLKELEERWQNCRSTGVEASAEIQAAAKVVLAENRKLRALLRERGVDETEVDRYFRGTDAPASLDEGSAAPVLSTLLSTRKACGGPEIAGSAQQSTLPHSSTPASNPSPQSTSVAGPLKAHGVPSTMPTTLPYQQPMLSPAPTAPATTDVTDQVVPHVGGRPAPLDHGGQPIAANPNTSSCFTAADILATMGYGLDTEQVRADLGCQSTSDCHVDNGTVFGLVDKYTATSFNPS